MRLGEKVKILGSSSRWVTGSGMLPSAGVKRRSLLPFLAGCKGLEDELKYVICPDVNY